MSRNNSSHARLLLPIVASVLLCCLVAASVAISNRDPIAASRGPAPGPVTTVAPQGQPPLLSKEYVYAGSRLIATEQPCSYALSAGCGAFPPAATESSLTVSAGASCGWTAASNASWITVSSQTSGTGNAKIDFIVRDNFTGAARQGVISVAGLTFSVVQTGSFSCAYTVSPSNTTVGPGGGAGTLNVSTTAGCAWRAVSNESWITIPSSGCGSGNGAVAYFVAANATGATRSGTITVNGRLFAIKQTGV